MEAGGSFHRRIGIFPLLLLAVDGHAPIALVYSRWHPVDGSFHASRFRVSGPPLKLEEA